MAYFSVSSQASLSRCKELKKQSETKQNKQIHLFSSMCTSVVCVSLSWSRRCVCLTKHIQLRAEAVQWLEYIRMSRAGNYSSTLTSKTSVESFETKSSPAQHSIFFLSWHRDFFFNILNQKVGQCQSWKNGRSHYFLIPAFHR